MITKIIVPLSIVLGSIFAQAEINFSYEMKYGDGKQVTGTASDNPDTLDYNYFENQLDINTNLGDDIYIYTQFEYSDLPVYGSRADGLNSFYLEYQNEKFIMKLGDQYELFGRGMSFYTLQNQNIDYDNSVKGLSFKYFMRENIEISALIGKGDYFYRSNPSRRETDLQLNSSVLLGSVNYTHDWLGYFQYMNTKQQLLIDPALTGIFGNKSEIYYDLYERAEPGSDLLELWVAYELGEIVKIDTVNITNHNFNWNFYLGQFDIYVDKAWVYYDKIFGDEVFGSRFYTAVYTDFMGTGITYEYKNYNTPYLIKTISNFPIVYREGSSILASRNAHTFNFGNEIGHQVDFNRQLFENINILGNLSLSHRHQKNGMAELSIMEFLAMNEDSEIYDYYPFRQMYLEVNGWTLSDRLYYKVGVDHFSELNFLNSGKNTYALTLPTHWVWKLSNGSSVTTYLEMQFKTEKQLNPPDFSLASEKNYTNHYFSFSYNHFGKWTLTGFYDREAVSDNVHQWPGFGFSYYLNSSTQISLFYGSQKGGLICANGICAEQPGFEDGVKITFRSLF
ncbi:hypothetical protein HX837_06225 [Marine Group I thaumarchaeote]|uniref:Uncharacterized protein n=1 Tax=Marine Group I thaumarchaeote TaxID=2511932 RepID=A0A7K4MQZ6_9ARCH|nr:hypothetical protein [Marine Group I thaumarchaeote]